MARLSADQAAKAILAGVKRGRRRIVVGADARMMDYLQRLLPTGYAGIIVKRMRGGSGLPREPPGADAIAGPRHGYVFTPCDPPARRRRTCGTPKTRGNPHLRCSGPAFVVVLRTPRTFSWVIESCARDGGRVRARVERSGTIGDRGWSRRRTSTSSLDARGQPQRLDRADDALPVEVPFLLPWRGHRRLQRRPHALRR